jgi:hypothetical protein
MSDQPNNQSLQLFLGLQSSLPVVGAITHHPIPRTPNSKEYEGFEVTYADPSGLLESDGITLTQKGSGLRMSIEELFAAKCIEIKAAEIRAAETEAGREISNTEALQRAITAILNPPIPEGWIRGHQSLRGGSLFARVVDERVECVSLQRLLPQLPEALVTASKAVDEFGTIANKTADEIKATLARPENGGWQHIDAVDVHVGFHLYSEHLVMSVHLPWEYVHPERAISPPATVMQIAAPDPKFVEGTLARDGRSVGNDR